ncbi:hypothetical protein F4782DRAFT_544560 [Xylaria castorea]|nr:hypothetical protein F4782DRAFT_544560 [Xylaria castorea]
MAEYLPLHRTSFASLEDHGFFSACSSQPASRLMSVFASQEHDQLAEDANSITRPSEPLVSVCLPLVESMLPCPREESPVLECLANSHDHVPEHYRLNATSGRRQSNQLRGQEPPVEPDTAYQVCLPLFTRTPLDSHASQQEIENILRNVRGYLSARQHRDSHGKPAVSVPTENNMSKSSSQAPSESSYLDTQMPALREDQYLVTSDDIVGIFDIIVTGVRKFQDDSIQPDCQSLLFPKNTHVKPTLNPQNIIPGAPAVVDPATTICLPRPCFSLADGLEVFRHPSPAAVTTYENHERAQHQETITDLYNRGVDAHSGVCLHIPLPILEDDPRTTSTCLNCSPFLDDYPSPIQGKRDQWLSQVEEDNGDHRQKPGRSIGVASHRRIKASEPRNQHQDLKENLLDGLRRYSFLPLLDPTPETIRRDHPAHTSLMEIPLEDDKGLKLSSQELLQQILRQSDTSSMRSLRSKSSSGALTITRPKESWRKLSEIDRGSCSEDTAPHICLDDQWRSQNFR